MFDSYNKPDHHGSKNTDGYRFIGIPASAANRELLYTTTNATQQSSSNKKAADVLMVPSSVEINTRTMRTKMVA